MPTILETKLTQELKSAEGVIALGVVDVDNGLVLGVAPPGVLPEETIAQLGDATRKRFEGSELGEIGAIMDERARRQPPPRYCLWDMWGSPNTIHYGKRLSQPNLVVIFVFPSGTSVGAAYTAATKALKGVEAACR